MDPEQIRLARVKEVKYLHTFPRVRESRRMRSQRQRVRLDKVDPDNQRRCQATRHSRTLVGREIKWKSPKIGRRTPRWVHHSSNGRNRQFLLLDVSRAHSHPKSRRELHDVCRPDIKPGHFGNLSRTMYGSRDAANVEVGASKNAAIDERYWAAIAMLGLPS